MTPKDQGDLAELQRAVRQQLGKAATARVSNSVVKRFASYDKNGDEQLSRDEVPRQLRRFFGRLDKNGDGVLSLEEAKILGSFSRRRP